MAVEADRDPRRGFGADAAERFGAELRAAFAAAAEVAGTRTWTLETGIRTIELRFAGPALAEAFLPALPRVREGTDPDADTVLLAWDTASTGVPRPALPWGPGDVRGRGDIAGFNDDRFGALWTSEDPTAESARQTLCTFDADARVGVLWTPSAAGLHWWERAAPLRPLLRWALAGPGRTLVHGGTVGRDGAGLLLAGAGGAGKTSTTLAAVLAGLQTAGDDYVGLDVRSPTPTAHAIYGGAKAAPRTLELLPALGEAVRSAAIGEGEKYEVEIARAWPERWATELALRGLVIPVLTGDGHTRVVPSSGGEGLFALAPSTVSQLPGDRGSLATMAALARAVPAFRLELGGSPEDGAAALGRPARGARGMSEALLSVVMPVWNGAAYVEEAVRSLLDQDDAGPLEVVVADDGSTDASADVAEAAGARVVRRPHAGVATARNAGLAAARGELLTFLDADDVSVPGSLRAPSRPARLRSGARLRRRAARRLRPRASTRFRRGSPSGSSGGSPAGGLWSFFARRALFDRIGPFDESFELAEDADWLGRVRAAGARGGTVDRPCTRVRLHPDSLTARRRDEVRPTLLRAMRAQVARQRAER